MGAENGAVRRVVPSSGGDGVADVGLEVSLQRRSVDAALFSLAWEAARLEVSIRRCSALGQVKLVGVLRARWRRVQDRMIILEARRP